MPITNAQYDAAAGVMKEVAIADGFQNFVSSLGQQLRDKGMGGGFFSRLDLTEEELTNIYADGGIGGKVVDCVAEDLGRVWRVLSLENGDVAPLKEFQKRLKVRSAIIDQVRWSRLYGSAVIIIEVEGDNPEDEFEMESISPEKPVTAFRVEHRREMISTETDEKTGRPLMYEISRTGEKFHPSRVIGPMDGIKLPVKRMRENGGWGASVLNRVYKSLVAEVQTALGLNSLVTEAKVDIVSVKDLPMYLDNGQRQQKLEARWMLAAQLKSLLNLLLIDKDVEEFNTSSNAVTIAGVGPLLETLANRISAESDIPMTRLFGKLASGLSTSGETNQDDYYDMLTAKREIMIEPELDIIDELSMRSVYGAPQEGFTYTWKPFRELSVPQQSDVDLKDSQTAKNYLDAGAIVPGHVAKRLREGETYPMTEEYVSFLEKRDGISGEASGEGENIPDFGENEGKENEARVLMEIAEAVKTGKIEAKQAEAILKSSFPDLPPEVISGLVNVEVEKPKPPPMVPGQPGQPTHEEETEEEEE